MIFLVVAVICLVVVDTQDDNCGYSKCIFGGLPDSKVDKVLVLFNFVDITEDLITQCRELRERTKNCENVTYYCRRRVTKPWEQRLTDDGYVLYLMQLTQWACFFFRPAYLRNIRSCTYHKSQSEMWKCVEPPYRFSASCVFDKFQENSQCTRDTQDFVRTLIDALAANPYNDYLTSSKFV